MTTPSFITRGAGRFRDLPVDRKLTVLTMVTTLAALIVSGIGIIFSDSVLFRQNMQRDLTALAEIIGDNTTAALAFDDPMSAGETLGSLRARSHVVSACLYRSDGSRIAQYLRSSAETACPVSPDEAAIEGSGDRSRSTRGDVTIFHPVVLTGRRIGTLRLVYDFGELDERIVLYSEVVIGVLIAASILGLMFSARLKSLISRPISNLADTADTVGRTKDYTIRAPKTGNDELGVLVDAFNEMLEAIQSRDVNLRKALLEREDALKDAEDARDSLATTLASIGDGVISTDEEGRVVLANSAAQNLLGWSETEIKGQPLDSVFHIVNELTRQRVESPVSKVLRNGQIALPESHTVLAARGGNETPIDESGAPIRDRSGNIRGTVLVFRDVTAKRAADETRGLLAAIVESSDDAIVGLDLNGTITSWNEGAERIFGRPAAQAIGQPASILAPPGGDEMPGVLARIGRGERVDQYFAQRHTNDGWLIDVSVTVSPLYDALGRIVGASKIARDVTEQVRAAERMAALNADLKRSNERLARSNEDLEAFAFVASHDFQEPLRMITIYSQLLLRAHKGEFDAQGGLYVENIVTGTQRIRDLLSDLLAYTEAGVKEEELNREVDLNAVLTKVKETLAAPIAETGAVITVELLPVLRAYEGHFISLFQNLIGNAIKYRSDAFPRIQVSVRQRDHMLEFAVTDNGIGISPEFHEKVFVAFRRLHGKSIPGTGIGLAICQRVVERYGGHIRVESAGAGGSAFVFTLPESLQVWQ
jgi:PAS domain S-box-containing protein